MIRFPIGLLAAVAAAHGVAVAANSTETWPNRPISPTAPRFIDNPVPRIDEGRRMGRNDNRPRWRRP